MRNLKVGVFLIFLTLFNFCTFAFNTNDTLSILTHTLRWYNGDSVILANTNGAKLSEWKDLSIAGDNAFQTNPGYQPSAYKSSLLNGHQVVHFDGIENYFALNGTDSLRTVVFVLKDTSNYLTNSVTRPLLGNTGSYEFWRPASGQLLGGYASSYLLKGTARINSIIVDPTTTLVPQNFSILSLRTAGGMVPFNSLTADRGNAGASWMGAIAEIIAFKDSLTDTQLTQVETYLDHKYTPTVNLGPDIVMNNFCDTALYAGLNFVAYKWFNKKDTSTVIDTTNNIRINTTGTYFVKVKDIFGFWSSDTINVSYPFVRLNSDTTICAGAHFVWNTGLSHSLFNFNWTGGSSDSLLTINQAGAYQLTITDMNGCTFTSPLATVQIDNIQDSVSLGNDSTQLCFGNKLSLVKGAQSIQSYLWSTGCTSASCPVTLSGNYSVIVADKFGCPAFDTIYATIKGVAPIANFTINNNRTCENDTIHFIDLSLDTAQNESIIDWRWQFGDNNTSLIKTANHVYNTLTDTGIFNVTLTVINNVGCSATKDSTIHIFPKPIPDFKISNLLYSLSPGQFLDNSNYLGYSPTTWIWNFGDVESGLANSSHSENPNHLYNASGNYLVTLVVMNNKGCEDSIQKEVYVNPFILTNTLRWYNGDSVILANTNGAKLSEWKDLSIAGDNAFQTNPGYQPSAYKSSLLNGHQVVHFDGIENYFALNGTDSLRTVVFVLKDTSNYLTNSVTRPLLGNTGSYEFWRPASGQLLGGYASSYLLKGTARINSIIVDPTTTLVPQNFSILSLRTAGGMVPFNSLTADRGNAGASWMGAIAEIIAFKDSLTDTQLTQVETYLDHKYTPTVNLGPDIVMNNFCDTALYAGLNFVAYKWFNKKDTSTVIDTTNNIRINTTGTYFVKVKDIFGFWSSDTINVSYPFVRLNSDTTICAGAHFVWNTGLSHSLFNFNWTGGSSDSLLTINQAGAYQLTITDMNGCTFTSPLATVQIDNIQDSVSLGNDSTQLCFGNKLSLVKGAQSIQSYLWSTGCTSASCPVTLSGNYSVIVADKFGCPAFDTIYATIKGVAPIANFTINSYTTCSGNEIALKDYSSSNDTSHIIGQKWNFGNNTYSYALDTSYTYPPNDTGIYKINLAVYTSNGCSDDTNVQIHIYPKPIVNFKYSYPCSTYMIQFNELDTLEGYSPLNYEWNFNDPLSGNAISNLPNPTHKFSTQQLAYNTVLKVTNNHNCIDSIKKQIQLFESPMAKVLPTSTCINSPVLFLDQSTNANEYKIFYGDGTLFSNIKNSTHIYSDTGLYNITYIVSSNNFCTDTSYVTIMVGNYPTANDSIVGSLCQNSILNFIDKSTSIGNTKITKWKWTFDDSITSTLNNPNLAFAQTGVHTSSLQVVTNVGCESNIHSNSFTIASLPNAMFTISPINENKTIPIPVTFNPDSNHYQSYLWNFGSTSTSSLISPTYEFNDSGNYTVSLTVKDSNSCTSSSSQDLLIQNPFFKVTLDNLFATIDTSGFLNCTINFTNLSTRVLSNIEIIGTIDNYGEFKNIWQGNLEPNNSINYKLPNAILLSNDIPHSFVCIKLENPNEIQLSSNIDNSLCQSINGNKFVVSNPIPNPTNGFITLPIVSPTNTSISIKLFDIYGKTIESTTNLTCNIGVNQYQFNLSNLKSGIYFYQVSLGNTTITKKIIVSH